MVADFLAFCETNSLPVDFVSTHHYPTDDFGKPGDNTNAQLTASKRGVIRKEAATVRKQAGNLPVYCTE
jgi:xylan 1,4-beta-xylosidase